MPLADEPGDVAQQVNVPTITDPQARASAVAMELPLADYLA
jgi:hypothetical protein